MKGPVVIDATVARVLPPLSPARAAAIAQGAIRGARIAGPAFAYDQWVVHNRFDAYRPFYRVDAGDAAGTRFYLSASTGEFVQRTDARERFWNWPGAVLHWLYLTPLRASFVAWDRTVWWASLVAMLGVVAGMVVGVHRTLTARRAGRPGFTFFRLRWLRWHHLLGLVAGPLAMTWIVSGWLSMDHGRLFARATPPPEDVWRYEGRSPGAAAAVLG